VFSTTYSFLEIGLIYIHEMERYVVVCFSQAFSSLLFIIFSIQKINRAIASGLNMKKLQSLEVMSSSMDGVIPAAGVSIFQILFLWAGTVPSP
jgi:hypothetical protein